MTATALSHANAINTFMFWTANFDYFFIEKVWKDRPLMAKHLRSKWSGMEEHYGSATIYRFYFELDTNERKVLLEWVMDNYKDAPKLR